MNNKIYLACFLLLGATPAPAQYMSTIAGRDSCGDSGDGGPAIYAKVSEPFGLCRDKAGNLYIGEPTSGYTDGSGRIRKISATGIITTIAGGGPPSATGDGIPATSARLFFVSGICLDTAGNLLITADETRVRKINLATGIITTVAGTLAGGYSGDSGPATATQLNGPEDVATDSANNIYIADMLNSEIRKVDATTGMMSVIAGSYLSSSYSGDGGPATAARINNPRGVYVDRSANVYIADGGNNRVRKIDAATGIIHTLAGTGATGDGGDGGPATAAEINAAWRVTLDQDGNIYIAEPYDGNRIRRIDAVTGIISTFAGNGTGGFSADTVYHSGPATSVPVAPSAICFDTCGNLFYADDGCFIRVITPAPPVDGILCTNTALAIEQVIPATGIRVYPNPATTAITIANAGADTRYEITDMPGRTLQKGTLPAGKPAISLRALIPGSYIITLYKDDIRDGNAIFVKE